MKVRYFLTLSLILLTAVPAAAQSNFVVSEYLRNYRPPSEAAPPVNPPSTMAQFLRTGEIPISLSDVVNMMLDQNLDIASNRLTPRSSALQTLVFYKFLQPSLSFTGTVSRNTAASTTQLNGAASLSTLQHNFSTSYTRSLATGTTLGVTATMARTSSNNTFSTFNPSYSGRVTYSASQHLLQNWGRNVNLRQIRQSENNEKISQTAFEIQLTSLLVTAQKAYWDLVFSEGDLKVKQDSLELAKRTQSENEQKVEIGTMARIDVVQTRLDVATRNDVVVGATGTVTQSQDQIKKLISDSKDPAMFLINLKPMESPKPPVASDIPSLPEAIATALENRPEIRQALLDLKNKEMDVEYTKNQKMPVLDLNASYTQNGTGGTQTVRGNVLGSSVVTQVIPGGVFDAFQQLFGYKYTGYSLGFTFTIPVGNQAAAADFSRAVNERKLSNSKIDATVQGIELDVRNALTALQVAGSRVDTARLTRDLAKQTLDAEQQKFELGTSVLRNVLEQQRTLAQDDSAQLQADVNYTKALVDLDRATGMTLKRNNIQVEKALKPLPSNGRTD
ncbi:MAG TPA: TolC family protein [Terriglobia bacterium]|nr:TolC family protein [Terriglobia bacterium]